MPLLKLHTSAKVPDGEKDALVKALSEIVASILGKPKSYMMVSIADGHFCMGGEVAPAAFADIRSIGGLNGEVNQSISDQVCTLLNDQLGISTDRIYLNFTNIPASDWGWNNGTFG